MYGKKRKRNYQQKWSNETNRNVNGKQPNHIKHKIQAQEYIIQQYQKIGTKNQLSTSFW